MAARGFITFTPIGKQVEARENETILDAARRAGVPIGNSCGAIGVCARCRIRVVDGADNLSAATAIEARVSAQRKFAADERMACQAAVRGDCVVTATYW